MSVFFRKVWRSITGVILKLVRRNRKMVFCGGKIRGLRTDVYNMVFSSPQPNFQYNLDATLKVLCPELLNHLFIGCFAIDVKTNVSDTLVLPAVLTPDYNWKDVNVTSQSGQEVEEIVKAIFPQERIAELIENSFPSDHEDLVKKGAMQVAYSTMKGRRFENCTAKRNWIEGEFKKTNSRITFTRSSSFAMYSGSTVVVVSIGMENDTYEKYKDYFRFDEPNYPRLLQEVIDTLFIQCTDHITKTASVENEMPYIPEALINQEIVKLMARRHLPDHTTINRLSFQYVEGEECQAQLAFINEGQDVDTVVESDFFLSIKYPMTVKIFDKVVRKLLSAVPKSENDEAPYYLIISTTSGGNTTAEGIGRLKEGVDVHTIEFTKHMVWVLKYRTKQVFSFSGGRYYLDIFNKQEQITQALAFIYSEFGITDVDNKHSLETIIKEATKQKHGTMIVISEDAKKESDRLAKVYRGFPIDQPIGSSGQEQYITMITSMDGALMVNPSGQCYGFGIIVDGEAAEGDPSRGARYNSAVSYVEAQRKKHVKCVACIFSEDGHFNTWPKYDA